MVERRSTLPEPGPGEVRVELEFGGVNPIDSLRRRGAREPGRTAATDARRRGRGRARRAPVLVAGEGLGAARDGVWAQAAVVPLEAP